MLAQNPTFIISPSLCYKDQFQVGDHVETYRHCKGTVVRVDNDESGLFIVVRFETVYGEFAYDPYDLKVIP
ncbi:hypothetical protein Desaci_1428 [Desulfosporosinus acidiphilus SJ4]|uniref:Uncharacterized protein n=1 Tax=Desulfosporosinus acidiphilus (strain DSM 22704 / JCM 16185 / SJ4) TaxID=646529 RepID=I4D3S3_DESAJ|nr:hypothetical protein [Desulfosporosinus acidiphilus]AFM40447.1 hypothetical protein Desaci_1428 [Desulfosporosinus acidiphilus SJ4]